MPRQTEKFDKLKEELNELERLQASGRTRTPSIGASIIRIKHEIEDDSDFDEFDLDSVQQSMIEEEDTNNSIRKFAHNYTSSIIHGAVTGVVSTLSPLPPSGFRAKIDEALALDDQINSKYN